MGLGGAGQFRKWSEQSCRGTLYSGCSSQLFLASGSWGYLFNWFVRATECAKAGAGENGPGFQRPRPPGKIIRMAYLPGMGIGPAK